VRLTAERWRPVRAHGTLLLLHGGGQTRHSWRRTAQRLADAGWEVITPDARGHGDSEWDPAGDYSLERFVDDLLGLIETLAQPPTLVGASLGGMTSLLALGEHAGVARGLVLVDVVIEIEPAGVEQIRAFMTAHRDGFASLEEVADAVAAYSPPRPRPRSVEGLRKNVRLRADGRWYWHWDPAFIGIDDEPQRGARTRLRVAAANVTVPTLLVRGAMSDLVSDAGVADMLSLIPAAEVVVVPAAGHMLVGADNDIFTSRLLQFLRRHEL
jgi:non-heme chloroperoxidase